MKLLYLVTCSQFLLLIQCQVIPELFTFPTSESAFGSTADGQCSNVTSDGATSTCTDPTSSVLFDGVIPTLTGLDGDMWASQLLTLQAQGSNTTVLGFDFTNTTGYTGVTKFDVAMFNCPERNTSIQTILLYQVDTDSNSDLVMAINVSSISCEMLVSICIDSDVTAMRLSLEFENAAGSDQVYLAEVTFNDGVDASCPDDNIVATTEEAVVTTAAMDSMTTRQDEMTSTTPLSCPSTCVACPSPNSPASPCPSSTSCNSAAVTVTAVVSVVVTAILATLVFALVQVIVCKCHPKFRSRSPHLEFISGGGDGQGGGAEGGVVIMHNPTVGTYMDEEEEEEEEEEGQRGGGRGGGGGGGEGRENFELKGNDAYIISNNFSD